MVLFVFIQHIWVGLITDGPRTLTSHNRDTPLYKKFNLDYILVSSWRTKALHVYICEILFTWWILNPDFAIIEATTIYYKINGTKPKHRYTSIHIMAINHDVNFWQTHQFFFWKNFEIDHFHEHATIRNGMKASIYKVFLALHIAF